MQCQTLVFDVNLETFSSNTYTTSEAQHWGHTASVTPCRQGQYYNSHRQQKPILINLLLSFHNISNILFYSNIPKIYFVTIISFLTKPYHGIVTKLESSAHHYTQPFTQVYAQVLEFRKSFSRSRSFVKNE